MATRKHGEGRKLGYINGLMGQKANPHNGAWGCQGERITLGIQRSDASANYIWPQLRVTGWALTVAKAI